MRQTLSGDRVLLPKAWETQLPQGFAQAIRAVGASVVCIDRIGII